MMLVMASPTLVNRHRIIPFLSGRLASELCLAAGFPCRVWAVVKGSGEVLGSAEMRSLTGF